MKHLGHISSGRLCKAWATAVLLTAAPVFAGDADVRQAVHEALSAELPSVHTETHLPDAEEPGRANPHERREEEQREHKGKNGEHEDGDRDRREPKDHDGHDGQEGRDRQ